jgi:hypothetical protein
MLNNYRHISQRVLLFLVLLAGFQTGFPATLQAKALLKGTCIERLFDHEEVVIPHILNDHFADDMPDDTEPVFYNKKVPPKRRFYIATSTQQFSYTSRFIHLPYDLVPGVPVQENKTGVYQQQHAFLPAYYTFLFRYTLF